LPILLDLLKQVRAEGRLAEVVFVDGNGILHPRRAGIASHLGVAAKLATIGIGKSLLCGKVVAKTGGPADSQAVIHDGEVIGTAMKATPGSRPIFVSPGNLVDVPFAERLSRLLLRARRVPEPIYFAHSLSRAVARDLRIESDVSPQGSRSSATRG
jgi:deoxyribonuclease V